MKLKSEIIKCCKSNDKILRVSVRPDAMEITDNKVRNVKHWYSHENHFRFK